LGEFLIDLYSITRDPKHLEGAYRVASGLRLFKIPKPAGAAVPGDGLRRISCDFGTGGAGVSHFLHRLTHHSLEAAFTLDSLLGGAADVEERADKVLTAVAECKA